jgi:hypothetical protein
MVSAVRTSFVSHPRWRDFEQLLNILKIREHPELDERWVKEVIAEDPSVLGVGDVILKDKERIQPCAGCIELLLQEIEGSHRYEVEIQLGKSDVEHIMRTFDYW